MKGTASLLLLLLFSPATLADTVVYVALAAEKDAALVHQELMKQISCNR